MRRHLAPPVAPNRQPLYVPENERVTRDNRLMDDPMSESYSREGTDYDGVGPSEGVHAPNPAADHPTPIQYGISLWPNPSKGGKVGSYDRLGWTRAIAPYRHLREPFRGGIVTLTGSKAHPQTGPVGHRDWLQQVAQNVRYNFVELQPTAAEVAGAFTFAPASEIATWESD